jgi:membrane protein YqaA with SNARE-associated domain
MQRGHDVRHARLENNKRKKNKRKGTWVVFGAWMAGLAETK